MSKNILSAVFFTLLVSAASAGPSQFISPSDIVQVKTNDEEDARDRSRWRESRSEADWYDGRQNDRAEAFKQYSFRPPEDDSDCFSVGSVWYCP
jgi:hypothetical protein